MEKALIGELKAMVAEDQRIHKPSPGQEKKFTVSLSLEQRMEWSPGGSGKH